ncbi:hypothetical protein BDA96_05G137600 [Sorghum bicolor]|jgi:hypothetical protein|nr:uncharacterized protein LOC8083111 [Sorghum bicolor]KAG0529904.1 hypothetical protein BDA96_05G137600 [Sorghum bicolor]|eukprot:XP_002450794.1 uncharacterized protein LOC8083111 [Sorghum bicolor]
MASKTTQPAPKPIAGYYHTVDPNYGSSQEGSSNNHVFVPSQSTASNDGSQFPLDFLPSGTDGGGWEIADSRGSLLLLYRGVKLPNIFDAAKGANPGLVVCEPMTRQYKEVPCSPEDDLKGHKCLGLFLLHGDKTRRFCGGGIDISLSNFKVMAALLRPHCFSSGHGVPVACMFSRSSVSSVFSMEREVKGAWRSSVFSIGSDWHIVKRAWGVQGIDVPSTIESFYLAGRACGSLYWGIEGTAGVALVLDEDTAGFSTAVLPEATLGSHGRCSFRVIGGGDGVMHVVRVIDNDLLKVYTRIHGGDDKWVVERLVRLREATGELPGREDGYFQGEAVIVDAHDTYVLLTPREKTWLFSVVLETMEVDRGHERNKYAGPGYPWELPLPVRKPWSPISRLFSCIEI